MSDGFESTLSRIQTLKVVDLVFLGIATICVALRFYVRGVLVKSIGIDDWAMLACWAMYATCCSIAALFATQFEEVFVTGTIPADLGSLVQVDTGLYALTMIALKISLSFYFLKIFNNSKRWQKYVIYFILGLSVAYGIVYFVMSVATCGVLKAFGETSGTCAVQAAYDGITTSWSITNAVTDLTFSFLALQVLWTVKIPLSTKITASALLLLGTIGGIASIIRISILLADDTGILEGINSAIWTIVEPGVGISAASLVTLRPLFRSCFERVKSVAGTYGGTSHYKTARNTAHSAKATQIPIQSEHDLFDEKDEDDLEAGRLESNMITKTTVIEMKDGRTSIIAERDLV